MQRKQFDYEAELARPMCQGCNKYNVEGVRFIRISDEKLLVGNYCTMYAARKAPKIMIEADECPHNYRRRRAGGKVRVGQGKGYQGGNR
jgi:hypothetical protein